MPKIVIKEYDKTKAGIGAYTNFSVVVPGFLGNASAEMDEVLSKFDENGIYECNSQADFLKYVGKQSCELIADKAALLPTSPKVTLSIKYDPLCELSGGAGMTDGITYMITDNSNTAEEATSRFVVTYKNQILFTEALNAWYTNALNFPSTLTGLQESIQYLISNTPNYEAPVEYRLASSTELYNEFKVALPKGEILPESGATNLPEGTDVGTFTLCVQVVNADGDTFEAISAQSLELVKYSTATDGKITFEAIDLGATAMADFKTSGSSGYTVCNGIVLTEDLKDPATNLGVRLINKESHADNVIYPIARKSGEENYTAGSVYKLCAVAVVVEDTNITYTPTDTDSYDLFVSTANPKEDDIGTLRDSTRIFIPAEASSTKTASVATVRESSTSLADGLVGVFGSQHNFNQADTYYIINNNEQGDDGEIISETVVHYGNQIAYELLGLGYTVLYKNLTLVNISDMINKVSLDEVNEYLGTTNSYSKVPDPEEEPYQYEQYKNDQKAAFAAKYCNSTKDASGNDIHMLKPEYSSIGILGDSNWWECLRDKSTYDFRYLVTGLMDHNEAANLCIAKIAKHDPSASGDTGRGDCVALIDIDRDCYSKTGRLTQKDAIPYIANEANKYGSDGGKYAAVFAPTVTYTMVADAAFGGNRTFPGSFHYLACAAKAAENYNEWYANAGYTRGVCNYTIEETGCKLGEVAVQALESRYSTSVGDIIETDGTRKSINNDVSVNLIIKIKNNYYLWGNRTAHKLGTKDAEDGDLVASHFLNIRQLCSTIKKQVYVACRRFTFDPNSNILWLNFCSAIRPTLEKMKADQGIKDYAILPEKTAQKGVLAAKIRIVPIEAVEDFYINLFLEDSITGPDAQVSESE